MQPKEALLCNWCVIERNGPQRQRGFQHLNGIVLNERNWGVQNDRYAAGFCWLRISDFRGEMEKSFFLGAAAGLPAVHRCLCGCVLGPGPPEGRGRRRSACTRGPTGVCRLTCEIWVLHGPVRSLPPGLMAFGEGRVAAAPAIPAGPGMLLPGGCCAAFFLGEMLLGVLAERFLSLWLWFERQDTSLARLLQGAGSGVKS